MLFDFYNKSPMEVTLCIKRIENDTNVKLDFINKVDLRSKIKPKIESLLDMYLSSCKK